MASGNPTYQELVERVEHMERLLKGQATLPLDSLPLASLSEHVANTLTPDGDQHLLPHSVGPDSLARVPAATIQRTAAYNTASLTHTCMPWDNIVFQQDVKIDLATFPTRITVVRPGLYWVGGYFALGSATNYSSLTLVHNGTGVVSDEEARQAFGATLQTASMIQVAKEGDYFELDYYTDGSIPIYLGTGNAGCLTPDARKPRLSVVYLSYVEGL